MWNIINGKEQSPLVIISDATYTSGLQTFIISTITKRSEECLFLCFKHHPRFYEENLCLSSRIKYYDAFSDSLNWSIISNNGYHKNIYVDQLDFDTPLYKQLDTEGKPSLIIIDDLDVLLRKRRVVDVCNFLKLNSEGGTQLVAYINPDITDEAHLKCLFYVATASMKFYLSTEPKNGSNKLITCDFVMKKPSGKVNSERLQFNFADCALREIGPLRVDNTRKEEVKEVDPAANLSFNLHLSNKEKEARSKVQLPYVLSTRSKDIQMSSNAHGGEIEYEPDEADDFDEDDPDDDLDI